MRKLFALMTLFLSLLIIYMSRASAQEVLLSDLEVQELAERTAAIAKTYNENIPFEPLLDMGKADDDSPYYCYVSSAGQPGEAAIMVFYCTSEGMAAKINIMHKTENDSAQMCSSLLAVSVLRAVGLDEEQIKDIFSQSEAEISSIWSEKMQRRINFQYTMRGSMTVVRIFAENE